MRSLDQFFRSAAAGLSHREWIPDDASVAFVLDGAGGGSWFLRREGRSVRVVPELPDGADARLQCSVNDFEALIGGKLDGRDGFLDGRLRIEGDVGLILALQTAFSGR
jgi:putative sterol carrier protein